MRSPRDNLIGGFYNLAFTAPVSSTYDVIVIGLGAMGSATIYQLARRGHRVLGLDAFSPPHTHGSSHGQTRIIREAYFEHPCYVPLLQRAYELWANLQLETPRPLFLRTGGLMIGFRDSVVVTGSLRSATEHRLAHELLTAQEIIKRFPALRPEPAMVGVLEHRAGILFPEACVTAHLDCARRNRAELRLNEPAIRWEPVGSGVRVVTALGSYEAARVIVTAGAWATRLFPDWPLPFQVERQILYWFAPVNQEAGSTFARDRCPIHLWQVDGRHFFYGFPDVGEGIKVARHHDGIAVGPDSVDRNVAPEEVEDMRGLVRRFLPGADGALRSSTVCLYTNTPDEHFWIDHHPEHRQVLIGSPCSGHGFKFASVMGEVLADLSMEGETSFDLCLFRAR